MWTKLRKVPATSLIFVPPIHVVNKRQYVVLEKMFLSTEQIKDKVEQGIGVE